MIYNTIEIEQIRKACRLTANTLEICKQNCKVGNDTLYINNMAQQFIEKNGGKPAFLGYKDYPFSVCMSVGPEILHSLPSKRKLCYGDVLKIDIGIELDGFFGDAATTIIIGETTQEVKKIISLTRLALHAGISQAIMGYTIGNITEAIQKTVELQGYKLLQGYSGHACGHELHCKPDIPNYGLKAGEGESLQPGMILCLEPMVTNGSGKSRIASDKWSVIVERDKLGFHEEHQILILPNGPPEILTLVT